MKHYPLNEKQFLADLRGLLQIKSVNGGCGPVTDEAPLGKGVYDALEYMLALGRKFGFRTKNLDGYCGWIEMGEGSRLVGSSPTWTPSPSRRTAGSRPPSTAP